MKLEILLLGCILLIAAFLRSYQITTNPPGLYLDEVSIGYNAYKILTTGKDEFGKSYPLFFKSFGDYKMPIYIYAVSSSMALFGKNEFAIRFPALITGTLSVIVLYFFVKELLLLDRKKYAEAYRKWCPYLAAFLLAISSWHIQFSRGGFEVTLAAFLYLFGSLLVTFFWKKQNILLLYFGYLLYILSMYSYHVFRIIVPLTLVFLSVVLYKRFIKQRKHIYAVTIGTVVLTLPLMLFSFSPHGSERFLQTSSFAEYKADTLLDKIKTYPLVYIKNYLSFFSLDFLFTFGDGIGRHQMSGFGLLYRWQLPFLLIGIVYLLRQKKSLLKNVIIFLLLVSPIAAAIARPSPHSLRSLMMVFPLTICIAFGLLYCFVIVKRFKRIAFFSLIIIASVEFSFYIHNYYVHYPKVNINDWDSGYKQIIQEAKPYEKKYDILVVDSNFTFLPTYFLFYNEDAKPYFVNTSWVKPKKWNGKKILLIRRFYEENKSDKIIHNVYLPNPNKDTVAQFWEL